MLSVSVDDASHPTAWDTGTPGVEGAAHALNQIDDEDDSDVF
jgi:hypothetical protein